MWMYHFLNDGGQRIQRNMFHRIWAFSQEADDTRVVNHLKRPPPTDSHCLNWLACKEDVNIAVFPPGYTWRDLALETEQMWSEVKDMPPRGVGGGLSLGGWSVRLLGSSPRVPSEELPAGQTDPPLLLSVFLFQLKTVSNKWNVNMVTPYASMRFPQGKVFHSLLVLVRGVDKKFRKILSSPWTPPSDNFSNKHCIVVWS